MPGFGLGFGLGPGRVVGGPYVPVGGFPPIGLGGWLLGGGG